MIFNLGGGNAECLLISNAALIALLLLLDIMLKDDIEKRHILRIYYSPLAVLFVVGAVTKTLQLMEIWR